LRCLGGGLDVPLDQRRLDRVRHFGGKHGLAGAGFALDQERALERDRGIHRHFQIVGRDIALGTFKTHCFRAPGVQRRRTLWAAFAPGKTGFPRVTVAPFRPAELAGTAKPAAPATCRATK
jgi:hypothetical protein